MKLRHILFALLLAFSSSAAFAQLELGMRDTRYVNAKYTFRNTWSAQFEQSLYSEKISHQYFRIYLGYQKDFARIFSVSARPFFGMTYSNSYSNVGADIDLSAAPLKWLTVKAGYTPLYDSGLGFSNCYLGRLLFNVTDHIGITGAVTNRPEYREPEHRGRLGLRFNVGRLWAMPEVSFPVQSSETHSLRVLVSLGYSFGK